MHYGLLDYFQGSWLGSIIGEAFASSQDSSERLKISQYQPESWLKPRSNIANCLFENRKYQIKPNITSDRLAILFLPLILSNFDNGGLLRQLVAVAAGIDPQAPALKKGEQMTQSKSYCFVTTEDIEDVLIWGNAISLAIREKLDPRNLIRQILLGTGGKNTSLIQKLEIVEQALIDGKNLTSLVEDLSTPENSPHKAISLSLYCFCSTPKDFYLAVRRAANIGDKTTTTAALTGALAGSYNGVTGIPISWRMSGNKNLSYQQAMEQATKLFYTWSGSYDSATHNYDFKVVAAPKTIQPRSNLKIISQTEY